MAYVIAHEVGHHVQNELGISAQLDKIRKRVSESEYNKYSVRLELQADYLAGCFSKYLAGETYEGQPILEEGDIDEAITAPMRSATIPCKKNIRATLFPTALRTGLVEQRINWFKRGYKYGDLDHGDTFNEKISIYRLQPKKP